MSIALTTMGKFTQKTEVTGATGGGTYIQEVEVERKLPLITIRHIDKEDKNISFKINKIEED